MGLHNARRVYQEARPDLWFAYDAGTLVGALLSVESAREGGTRGSVENCLVTDRCRQSGIATRLMDAAEAHYRSRGLAGMEFAVRRNLEAYDSLLRADYQVVRVYYKDKQDWEGNPIRNEERHIVRKDFVR